MTKPLELTIYPRREKVGRLAQPGYVVGKRGVIGYMVEHMTRAKRFAGAELAAAYWAACANCATIFPRPQNEWGRAETLHRFAIHPHYYEEQR